MEHCMHGNALQQSKKKQSLETSPLSRGRVKGRRVPSLKSHETLCRVEPYHTGKDVRQKRNSELRGHYSTAKHGKKKNDLGVNSRSRELSQNPLVEQIEDSNSAQINLHRSKT